MLMLSSEVNNPYRWSWSTTNLYNKRDVIVVDIKIIGSQIVGN